MFRSVDIRSHGVPIFRATTEALDRVGPAPESRSSHLRKIPPHAVAEPYPSRGTYNLDACFNDDAPGRAGRPVEVVAIVEDITRHKLAEIERERLLSEVEAERKRLEAVASQMPLGLLISDREGKLIFFNQEGERLLGHPLKIGSDYLDYARFGPAHQDGTPLPATEHAMGRALLKGEVIRDEEGPYRRPDGSITTLQISAAPVYDEAKNMIGTVALLGDISL